MSGGAVGLILGSMESGLEVGKEESELAFDAGKCGGSQLVATDVMGVLGAIVEKGFMSRHFAARRSLTAEVDVEDALQQLVRQQRHGELRTRTTHTRSRSLP